VGQQLFDTVQYIINYYYNVLWFYPVVSKVPLFKLEALYLVKLLVRLYFSTFMTRIEDACHDHSCSITAEETYYK